MGGQIVYPYKCMKCGAGTPILHYDKAPKVDGICIACVDSGISNAVGIFLMFLLLAGVVVLACMI